MLVLQFDGLFRGAPGGNASVHAGFMSYGWLIYRDEEMIARGHGVVVRGKDASSNVAEYLALIEGMEALLDLGVTGEPVTVCGDARTVIEQMNGAAGVNSATIRPLYARASRLASHFTIKKWQWLPRRFNKDADELTRWAMRQLRDDPQHYEEAVRSMSPGRLGAQLTNKFHPVLDLRVYLPGAA